MIKSPKKHASMMMPLMYDMQAGKTKTPTLDGRKSKSKRKSLVRIPVKKGKLYGYHLYMPANERRILLVNLIKTQKATFSDIIKRLNALAIFNMRRHPETSAKIGSDIEYIERTMSTYRLSPRKIPYKSPFKKTKKSIKKKKKKSLKKAKSLRKRKSRIRKM